MTVRAAEALLLLRMPPKLTKVVCEKKKSCRILHAEAVQQLEDIAESLSAAIDVLTGQGEALTESPDTEDEPTQEDEA